MNSTTAKIVIFWTKRVRQKITAFIEIGQKWDVATLRERAKTLKLLIVHDLVSCEDVLIGTRAAAEEAIITSEQTNSKSALQHHSTFQLLLHSTQS